MVHQYKNHGYNIVLDVYSGSVHVVDDLCYDVIGSLNAQDEEHTKETLAAPETMALLKERLGASYEEEELTDALAEIMELTDAGRLFTKDEFEGMTEIVRERKTVVKALCLHIAHDFNLD